MTDEELKEKLLATQWSSRRGATIPINPDGKAAWNRIEKLEAKNARFKEALEATTQALYTFCPSPATFTINGATKSIYDVINDAADALEKENDDEG